jgi:DNA repair protein RadC
MKAVSPHDRPREKLERLGVSALGDNELIALVLGSGSRDVDALALANQLLAYATGLHGLGRLTPDELRRVAGIGRARSAQLLAAVELGRRTVTRGVVDRPRLSQPSQLADLLLPQYGSLPVEHFGVVLLDTKCRLIRIKIISVGSIDTSVVHPREVFREATSASAATVVLFHNHPSGDPTPSRDDIELTNRMLQAGWIMGIEVVDHLILADQRYYSFSLSGGVPRGAV